MSQFVNFSKRSVTLPAGCKNLIDVLQHQGLQRMGDMVGPELNCAVSNGGTVKGKLCEIGQYVEMAYKSRALAFTLLVSSLDERIFLSVVHIRGGTIWASVAVEKDTAQETAVRRFFARHGLHSPDDWVMPKQLYPGVAAPLIFGISPLPSGVAKLSALVVDFFREVCRFNDGSELNYHHGEHVDAA